jgi:hypothetical protein
MSRQYTIAHFNQGKGIKAIPLMLMLLMSFFFLGRAQAQTNSMGVDMSMIDGIELNADNIFNYRIDNRTGQSQQVEVVGRVYYRRSGLNFNYRYNTTVQPGQNNISRNSIPTPTWIFSENALRELFLTYNKLPQGTYEYCITVTPKKPGAEQPDVNEPSACAYQTVEDIFLINLVTPENDAKIYEYNPMLAWVVNYPFASELTYKLRVAELKEGQNPQNAITRNNPMYKDDHVMTTGTVYPVTAKPLQKWQPYVWTVDAYYKGILLGGAEVWKFTIVDDSELNSLPKESFYVDIRQEKSTTQYYAVGEVKLKYVLDEKNEEQITILLQSEKGIPIKLKTKEVKMILGDNRLDINLKEEANLKHLGKYTLIFKNSLNEVFYLSFKYVNPDLLN